ncbi:uncharacterized protein LOC144357229 [Saccoglossus kowalevskii]
MTPNCITIGHWNTAGLRYNYKPREGTIDIKTEGSLDIEPHIKDYHIYGMTETWLNTESKELIPQPKGYYTYHNIRTKNKKAWRSSGGISIFIRNSIKSGVKIMSKSSNFSIWCQMSKDFFNLEMDIYIGTIYIPPKNSTFYNDNDCNPYDEINKEIQQYSLNGHVIIQGDFNARTKDLEDTIQDEQDNLHINMPLPDTYTYDKIVKKRRNTDTWKNEFGEELTQLCKENRLRILNGRTSGDWSGQLTCYGYHGASTVDYAITSETLLQNILHFKVEQLQQASDHCPIKTILKIPKYKQFTDMNEVLKPVHQCYQWNAMNKGMYKLYMKTKESEDIVSTFIVNNNNNTSHDMAIQFQEMIHKIANKCSIKLKTKKKTMRRKVKYTDRQCNMKKKELQTLANILQKNPSDGTLRMLYYTKKKDFRKYVKSMQKDKKQKILSRIESANENEHAHAQEFWKKINSITKTKVNYKLKEIPHSVWTEHFQRIGNNNSATLDRIKQMKTQLEQLENKTEDNHKLNKPISLTEVVQATGALKNNKASGPDGIPGEMLKYSNIQIKQALKHMYNRVLETGIYPEIWSTSVITPIHKKGDKMDTNNYRGISVGNVIAKVFSIIINNRITNHTENNKIIHPNQAGFRRKKTNS